MLIPLFCSHALATGSLPGTAAPASAAPEVHRVDDPVAGVLVDVVEPGLECSSGVVVTSRLADGGIEVRELHDGRVTNDDLHVSDPSVQAALAPGQKVLVYRDAHGVTVASAS